MAFGILEVSFWSWKLVLYSQSHCNFKQSVLSSSKTGFMIVSRVCVCVCVCVCVYSGAQSCQLFATPWIVACKAPFSMEFCRREYQSGLPFATPGDLPDLGIEPASSVIPALAGRFFITVLPVPPLILTY